MAEKRLDNTDMLESLSVRTLVFLGDQDASLPAEHTRELLEVNRHITTKILPGVGHSAFIEDAVTFNRELAQFVLGGKNVGNAASTVLAH
jgi:pimeloyl-ACP methyl ester carboxylesterase